MAKGRTNSAKPCTKCGETDVDIDGGGKSEDEGKGRGGWVGGGRCRES